MCCVGVAYGPHSNQRHLSQTIDVATEAWINAATSQE